LGICAAGDVLYFADSESSAVRVADRDPHGGVRTIVGTGLFDFGDVDGVGDEVRMQHQQGIALAPGGRLLVCDSYNDALKWVDPTSRRAESWVRGFEEPSGLAIGEHAIYVADTNAHRIAVVHPQTGEVRSLEIEA
jgi:DNA-binding beta-propeller fold protein YncE